MQMTDYIGRRLAELLAIRVEQFPAELGGETHPDAIASLLTRGCIAAAHADALAWGTPVKLSALELEQLACVFMFHPNLLALYVHPAGDDVVERTLTDLLAAAFDDDCERCEDLRLRAELYLVNEGGLDEPLEPILYDLLQHITVRFGPSEEDLVNYADPVSWLDDNDDGGDDENYDPQPFTDEQRARWEALLERGERHHAARRREEDRVAALQARLLEAWTALPPTIQEQIVAEVESAAAPVDVIEQLFGDESG